jgi:hypothetical protein
VIYWYIHWYNCSLSALKEYKLEHLMVDISMGYTVGQVLGGADGN